VNWYAGGGVMARSFGIVNAVAPLDVGMSTTSYALEASNATVVQLLQRYATIDTPQPFLMYLMDNTTLWPRGDWPAGGLAIKRPVHIVGWSDKTTAISFGYGVGRASLTGRWSNLTLDSLVLEHLAFGEPGPASSTNVHSAVSATNLWFFDTTRCAAQDAP